MMVGVDLGLGRGHHNVICGERLYQHIILLSTHYLYQTYFVVVNPFIKYYTKFGNFFKTWAIFWNFNRAILHFCWISTLICPLSSISMKWALLIEQTVYSIVFKWLTWKGVQWWPQTKNCGFSGDGRCRGSANYLGTSRTSFLSPLIGLGGPR